MKLDDCKKCEKHIDNIADQVLCSYFNETDYKVTFEDKEAECVFVVDCPKEKSKLKTSSRVLSVL